MPIPKRNKNESEDKFIARCMSSEVMKREFLKQKQRLGVCYTKFRKRG